MVAVVAASDAKRAMDHLRASGETVYEIGVIEKAPRGEPDCVVV
jgi:phosphoribosylaminoimidazole (AIR) synthetase